MKEFLKPSLDDVRLECVLMQAWKKTSSYLRYHSWYADTLEIDYQALRIPDFISKIQKKLDTPEKWKPQPLKMVPAPKSQKWEFRNNLWNPKEDKDIDVGKKLRPLAHAALEDQVLATAIAICLANRVETSLGDPRLPIKEGNSVLLAEDASEAAENRRTVLAYGNRLFCDSKDSGKRRLFHRWGSTKFYRQYFQDYRTFLSRPGIVADIAASKDDGREIAIVRSDLSKFYDRVRPELLSEKLRGFERSRSEKPFFDLAQRVFNWRWSDREDSRNYGEQHVIENFSRVALPQGLAASGFFANIVLSGLDSVLREKIGGFIDSDRKFFLEDACYYVDDMRFVVRIENGMREEEIKNFFIGWLQSLLDSTVSSELKVDEDKTDVTVTGRKSSFIVPQHKAAQRIQNEISGTFDMLQGSELIGAIENFFHTQKKYPAISAQTEPTDQTNLFIGVSDIKDETAARFAAGRFRRTFRSLRPMLPISEERENGSFDTNDQEEVSSATLPEQLVLSRQQLDERARLFSMLLIEEWVANPVHVRLLRIAFDMYPDLEFLEKVLKALRPGWKSDELSKPENKVRIYCLSELFRAGATETAMVTDEDCLPAGVSSESYHRRLTKEAIRVLKNYLRTWNHPWYLMQQVLLYLAARDAFPEKLKIGSRSEGQLARYFSLADFLRNQPPKLSKRSAIFLIIASSGFGISDFGKLLGKKTVSKKFLAAVNEISPEVASRLWSHQKKKADGELIRAARVMGLEPEKKAGVRKVTVADASTTKNNPFLSEPNILEFGSWLMQLKVKQLKKIVSPWRVRFKQTAEENEGFGNVKPGSFEIDEDAPKTASRLFKVPDWCEDDEERRKFQIGLFLRFAVRGTTALDSNHSARYHTKPLAYNRPVSHWEQQRYSGYHGRSAFGEPWLPLSSFVEDLLFDLLRWPGAGISTEVKTLENIFGEVKSRIRFLRRAANRSSQLFLEQKAPFPYPTEKRRGSTRSLRMGIVQSIIPEYKHYKARCKEGDAELKNDKALRILHRAHTAALLGGVSKMLSVPTDRKKSGEEIGNGLDLLVFPELAIHPDDLKSLIFPFIRKYKCIVLCGMVYHPKYIRAGRLELINSCLWLVPEWTKAAGFQVRPIEQGKKHLTREEKKIVKNIVGFRPVQWLVEYDWKNNKTVEPLVLSASVCFDATDLTLAADLRLKSDLYIVCALNKDVATFDRMSESLHYHMFQGIAVVNNGSYGGSSLFMPFKKPFLRRVFHLHGQPQASISFAEISPEKLIRRPEKTKGLWPEGEWKTPPAGWRNFHDD